MFKVPNAVTIAASCLITHYQGT